MWNVVSFAAGILFAVGLALVANAANQPQQYTFEPDTEKEDVLAEAESIFGWSRN